MPEVRFALLRMGGVDFLENAQSLILFALSVDKMYR